VTNFPPVPPGTSAAARELADLTAALLESLRIRAVPPVFCTPPLEAALLADRLFSASREREGIVRIPGEMSVDLLQAPEDVGTFATVDVAATITFPGEDYREGSRALDPAYKVPSFPSTTTEIGPATFQRTPDGWQLFNYVLDGRTMSASWCTHPSGEDRAEGIAAVSQAVRKRDKRTGAIYIEVSNGSTSDVVVAIGAASSQGPPSRLTRLLRRTAGADQGDPAPRGLFVPAGEVGHLAGRTIHPNDTDVVLTAYDDATRVPIAELSLMVKLAAGHPGTDDEWCGYPPVTLVAPNAAGGSA
jgi:hypothetical protein